MEESTVESEPEKKPKPRRQRKKKMITFTLAGLFENFLLEQGFVHVDDIMEPDWSFDYCGYRIGTCFPNGGALTVDILVDSKWLLQCKDGDMEWSYNKESVQWAGMQVVD